MKEEEKQRKFHDALLKMLYPPPPSPSSQEDDQTELDEGKNLSSLPEEASASSSDGYAEEISGNDQKLTRAQRKRLRKSKLKEAASQRRKIIGPLLPASNDNEIVHNHGSFEVVNNMAEGVRQNAATIDLREATCCLKKNKLKKRRKFKKLGFAKLNSSSTESGTSNPNKKV